MIRPLLLATLAMASPAFAEIDPTQWDEVVAEARGQTVYWNAWGGASNTNAFIDWVGDRVSEDYGVTLEHVKISDTAAAVTRVLSEKAAGRDEGGAVDMIWINGENFLAMKENDLLFGPFAEALPNWQYVDVEGKPAVLVDFTEPTDGIESPWAMAQLVFEYDAELLPNPPRSAQALLEYAKANPGRVTYPQPPNYLGTTFLKQVLYGVIDDPEVLQFPAEDADYDAVTAPLWAYLDELTPHVWRSGQAYPQNEPRLAQLLADGETDLAFAFNPARASAAIADGELPETVRTYVFDEGTLGNASFVAIPYNSSNTAGALVIANHLLAPSTQARAQDPEVLGFQTVLDMAALDDSDRAVFEALDLGIATLPPAERGTSLLEPHASWTLRIQDEWIERYGVAE